MSTWVGLNIITGRTGTAHVSSGDDAAIWRGFVGNENKALYTDQHLALNYQTKGELTVDDGVFCIGGRMGRISNTKTVDYALPEEGYYRRTLLIVRYALDATDNTESMTLMTLQNDPANDTSGQGGASAASVLSIDTDDDTDFILYDFVCNNDGVVSSTLKRKFEILDTIPGLRDDLEDYISTERTARQSDVSGLSGRIYTLETWKPTAVTSISQNTSNIAVLDNSVNSINLWKETATGQISHIATNTTEINSLKSRVTTLENNIGQLQISKLNITTQYYSQHDGYSIRGIPLDNNTTVILCLSYGGSSTEYVHIAFGDNAATYCTINGIPVTGSGRGNGVKITLGPVLDQSSKLYFKCMEISRGALDAVGKFDLYLLTNLSLESAATWNSGRGNASYGDVKFVAGYKIVNI